MYTGGMRITHHLETGPLSPAELAQLRRLVEPRGARHAGRQMGVSREVVVSALAGLPLRRGSLALLHAALASHVSASRKESSPPAAA